MKAFAEPYYVQENFWGITSRELAEVTGETLERVNWVIEKMRREKKATEVDVLKIEGSEKSPSEGIYALSPDGIVGAAFLLNTKRAWAYARYMVHDEYRIALYRDLSQIKFNWAGKSKREMLEWLDLYRELLKKLIVRAKLLSVKNSVIRLIYKAYASSLNETKRISA